jgi:hypothetical protein
MAPPSCAPGPGTLQSQQEYAAMNLMWSLPTLQAFTQGFSKVEMHGVSGLL